MTIYSTAYYYHAAVPAVRVVVMRFRKITPIKSYKPLDQKKRVRGQSGDVGYQDLVQSVARGGEHVNT